MHSSFLIVTSLINMKHIIQGKLFFFIVFLNRGNAFEAFSSAIAASPDRLKINVVYEVMKPAHDCTKVTSMGF